MLAYLCPCLTLRDIVAKALELAGVIAEKSPIATLGTKHTLNHAQDHTVEESLAYQVTWNMAMLNSSDLGASVMASMKKSKPVFAKLWEVLSLSRAYLIWGEEGVIALYRHLYVTCMVGQGI
jgi:hypothetical protein